MGSTDRPRTRTRTVPLRTLFPVLLREEWRLHTNLFGGWRFALFPLLIAGLTAGAGVALAATGTSSGSVIAGVHALALVFGLYSGTAAFAGSDMLESVFGRLSFVLSSASTLPLSRRRLLGVFLLKDALFYGVVFVLPMALGVAPLLEDGLSASILPSITAVWLSLCLTFAAGMAATVALIAFRTRGAPTSLLGAGVGALAFVGWTTPVGEYLGTVLVPLEGTLASAGGLAFATLALAAGSIAAYDPTYAKPARTASDRFVGLTDALSTGGGRPRASDGGGNARTGLVAKTLLDLARSSGGVVKPFVSVAVLFGLVAALVGVVTEITGLEPAPGIFFGGVLGLSAFTTYNWLTQFDSVEEYLVYPVSVEDVFRAKRTAFLLVGAPTVALPYLAALVWLEATFLDALAGAALLVGYGLYYYALTVYIAGFDPNEFLFDTVRFATFTVGVAVALVPPLVAGFVVVPPSAPVAGAVALGGIGFGAIGAVLSSRAGPRWERRYREG
ncbi:hypothetical protein ACFQGT_11780 [Natrialbaceae archaeon GCM10025810]|uniref:hypothetical protein n=1 Tax=Halovalidus salilacus TaxID=3075124 RepID=UPI00361B2C3A